jgi:putative transposase
LRPRKRTEQVLVAVVQQAYVCGVSTRRVDQLVESLGLRTSRSEVSRICALLDYQVEDFRQRPLEGRCPYLVVNAKVGKVRDRAPSCRSASSSPTPSTRRAGARSSARRRRCGDGRRSGACSSGRLSRAASPASSSSSRTPTKAKNAIARTVSCPWQRCTVHFLRDCLGHARRDQHGLLAALIRPIFNQPNREEAGARLREGVAQLERPLPKVARILEQAEDEILAFYAVPTEHWRKLRSTNPLERLNREIGRRTDVVGIFPDDASLIRLATSLIIEQNDEWLVGRRYLSLDSLAPLLEEQREHEQEVLELTTA